MTKITKLRGERLFESIKATCPPGLLAVIQKHKGYTRAAAAMHMSKDVLMRVATGTEPMNDKLRAALMAEGADPHDAPAPQAAPEVTIPPWNGKVAPYSYITRDGKKQTIKKMPVEFALLLKRERGVLNTAAKAIGYSGWTSVRNIIESGKYEEKLHANVYLALAGLPIKAKTNGGSHSDSGDDADTHLTGFVVCVVALAEYDRLEELADVMGGKRIFRMASGAGTIVMYRIHDRDKRETFKRLAQRDAKKIVCP